MTPLLPRPQTPDVRRSLAPTDHTTTGTTCFCQDTDVEQLRDLIAAGMDQAEASHRLWGKPDPTPAAEEDPPRFRWIGARERST